MSTKQASVEIITNAAGKDDRLIDFSINDDAEVDQSCSIIWNNDLYVYGGNERKTQISKVIKCRLERVGTLAFHHSNGDCHGRFEWSFTNRYYSYSVFTLIMLPTSENERRAPLCILFSVEACQRGPLENEQLTPLI